MNFIKKTVGTAVSVILSAVLLTQSAFCAVEGNIAVRGKIPVTEDSPADLAVFTWNNVTAEDLRKKSDIQIDELNEYIKRYPYISGIGDALIKAQSDHSVNLILLLAIIRLESGNGTSHLARTKNNLGGLTSKNGYQKFADKNDCVAYMAKLLGEKYLDSDGCYYSGYSLRGIARRYSGAPDQWVSLVSALMIEIQRQFD